MTTPKEFYYQVKGTVIGPLTGVGLREAALAGEVVLTTLVASGVHDNWVSANNVYGLFDDDGKPLPHPIETMQYLQSSHQRPNSTQVGTSPAVQAPPIVAALPLIFQGNVYKKRHKRPRSESSGGAVVGISVATLCGMAALWMFFAAPHTSERTTLPSAKSDTIVPHHTSSPASPPKVVQKENIQGAEQFVWAFQLESQRRAYAEQQRRAQSLNQALSDLRRQQDPWAKQSSPSPSQLRRTPQLSNAGSSCKHCGSWLGANQRCSYCDSRLHSFQANGSSIRRTQQSTDMLGSFPNQWRGGDSSSPNNFRSAFSSTSTPNLAGGYSYRSPTGTWNSTPNYDGGFNYRSGNGTVWSSSANFNGGSTLRSATGQPIVTSTRNLNGGYDYRSTAGETWSSTPNFNGGFDYRSSTGKTWSSKRNINGGLDYSGR